MKKEKTQRKFIFLTDEGLTYSPNGEDVENYQLLGTECGINEKQALTTLLKENPWIKESGFKRSKIFSRELIS